MSHPQRQLVIGTAGHIDHGKSALVRALTGVDPDRLPEEQARGLTIDLGFAHTRLDDLDVWFVDVPGHEKFIRNMVAGAAGVDVALLVVAADDSVMPQTREHAELLRLLGIYDVILAVTKCDLVDEAWAQAVAEESGALLAELGLVTLATVHTSAATGTGLPELRSALRAAALHGGRDVTPYTFFRLPIDRVFSVPGRGTVVTGTVSHGAVAPDTELDLLPQQRRIRVRDLQTHLEHRAAVTGRLRLGCNLAGISRDEVSRGCELATPGYLAPATCLTVRLTRFRMPGAKLHRTLPVRLHLAAAAVRAELRLLVQPATRTFSGAFAQLRTDRPVSATWNQPFALRDDAEKTTLGGGRVLEPRARAWSRKHPPHPELLEQLESNDANERILAMLHLHGWRMPTAAQIAARAGLADRAAAVEHIRNLVVHGDVVELVAGDATTVFTRCNFEAAAQAVAERIVAHLRANPRSPGIPRSELAQFAPRDCPRSLREALLAAAMREGWLISQGDYVLPAGHAPSLPEGDQRLLEEALLEIQAGGVKPPQISALGCRTARNAARLDELLRHAEAQGRLYRLTDDLWLHADAMMTVRSALAEAFRSREQLTVAEIRTLIGSSRKYVVPLVELLDRQGVTIRRGDYRFPGPALTDSATGGA